MGHLIEKASHLPYCCSLGFEPYFVVRLPAFLINTQREINAAAVEESYLFNVTKNGAVILGGHILQNELVLAIFQSTCT